MNIFSDSFLLEGNDKNSLILALEKIAFHSKHVPLSFKNLDIGHLEVKNNKVYVINMKQYGASFLENGNAPPKKTLLDENLIDEEISSLIFDNKIRTCLLLIQGKKRIPIFITDEARKYIVLRLGAKGQIFYETNVFADLALQRCLEHYNEKDFDTFNILKDKNTMVLTSVLSKPTNSSAFEEPLDKITNELNDNDLNIFKYKISNTQIMAEFQPAGYENEDFVPRIRIIMTDTGYYKKLLCVTTKDAVRSCILQELNKETTTQEAVNLFKKISAFSKEDRDKVNAPYSLLKSNRKIKMVGNKRIASIKEIYSAKSFTKKEFLKNALLLPDLFGSINPTTDFYLESGIGELFVNIGA